MPKPLVENKTHIQENLRTFEGYLNSADPEIRKFAFTKIRAGQNFIAYLSSGEFHFAPSRYIGHRDASIANYSKSKGNGGRTDSRISKILKHEHSIDIDIEEKYFNFVSKFQMGKPHDKTHKKHRKFWLFDKSVNIIGRDTGENDDIRKSYYKTLARKNQAKFRQRILNAYNNKCAITGFSEIRVLEAAHIKPFSEGEINTLSNGILLRVDLHRLFDEHLMAIHPESSIPYFASSCKSDYSENQGKKAYIPDGGPASSDLEYRWKEFKKRHL